MARMTEDRRVVRATGEIIEPGQPGFGAETRLAPYDPNDRIEILDPLAADGIATDARRAPLAIATISAGFREKGADGKPGFPQVSRDGRIYLHDPRKRAPGLKAALEARGYQSLTIAFPHDDWRHFVQQRFVLYSASKLQIYGDGESVTLIDGPQKRTTFWKHSQPAEYRQAIRQCKVQISIYFHLAEWSESGPTVVYPQGDGRGMYRIRTTSRNSIRILDAAIAEIAEKTHGHVAGIPFDAIIDYLNTSGPDGSQRTVPVWTFVCRPPFEMRAQLWAEHMTRAIAESQYLQLPAPRESYESQLADDDAEGIVADGDDPVVDVPSEEELQRITSGREQFPASVYEAAWFACVRGSSLDSDQARADFIADYTASVGATAHTSLKAYLREADPEQAAGLIAAARMVVSQERRNANRGGASYERSYGTGSALATLQGMAARMEGTDRVPPMFIAAEPTEASGDVLPQAETDDAECSEMPAEPTLPVDLGPAVASDEPTDADAMPSAKDRTDYDRLLVLAEALGLDLAPYEIDASTTRAELLALGAELKDKCKTAQQAMTGKK